MRAAVRLLELSRDESDAGRASMTLELQRLLSQAFESGRATGWSEAEELRGMVEGQ